MRRDVMRATIDGAHALQLKAYAHAPPLQRAKEVLRAGGDGLVRNWSPRPDVGLPRSAAQDLERSKSQQSLHYLDARSDQAPLWAPRAHVPETCSMSVFFSRSITMPASFAGTVARHVPDKLCPGEPPVVMRARHVPFHTLAALAADHVPDATIRFAWINDHVPCAASG